MKTGIFLSALLSLFGASAFASEWNSFLSVKNDNAEFFFDAESVNKTKDSVTLWVKTVQKSLPHDDGSWSTAYNWQMNCQKRTIKLLSRSTYDSANKLIKSSSGSGSENSVVPDSVGEGILKVACMADFPRKTPATKNSYSKIVDNDIFEATKFFVEYKKNKTDNAPK